MTSRLGVEMRGSYFILGALITIITSVGSLPPEALPAGEAGSAQACDPNLDFSLLCQMSAAECAIIDDILHGVDGAVLTNILSCSKALGIPLSPQMFLSDGITQVSESQSYVINSATADPEKLIQLRYCVLNASELVSSDGKLNRVAISSRIQSQLWWAPDLAKALCTAVAKCPEPIQYDVDPFFKCLYKVCIAEVPQIDQLVVDYYDPPFRHINMTTIPTFFNLSAGGFAF